MSPYLRCDGNPNELSSAATSGSPTVTDTGGRSSPRWSRSISPAGRGTLGCPGCARAQRRVGGTAEEEEESPLSPALELPRDCPGSLIRVAGHLRYHGRYLGGGDSNSYLVLGLQPASQSGFQEEEKWILQHAHDHSRLQSCLHSHWLSSVVMSRKMMQQERPIVKAVATGAP